ncbi:hypothetical protein ABPG77_001276 [Micractinium sp. CCAP 211/92]
MEPAVPEPQLLTVVKLGGAAITHKHAFESLNQEVLQACARLLAALHRELSCSTARDEASAPARLVVVHGAGSFGHHTASQTGVAHGGIATSPTVRRGFADTRASVTRLNQLVVSALLAAGVPAVGLSPCGAWSTRGRAVASDGCASVAGVLAAGLVPVLHGDAVLDAELGCTILSGDLIISRLCERFRPPVVAFLTNVDGIFDRPPEQDGATLIARLEVDDESDAPCREGPQSSSTDSGGFGPRCSSSAALPPFAAFAADGGRVPALQTAAAAHDTTGGVATKIREAAAVARLGAEVRIAAAGGPSAAAACSPAPLPAGWVGTVVQLRRKGNPS